MQEIKKRRIVIASVLKPATDTRMYAKIGLTLATQHEVHVIGWGSSMDVGANPAIHFIGAFPRLSIERMLAPFRILFRALKLRPDVFIASTHELLTVAMILKLFTGCQIWYDVQENHSKNIRYTPTFPQFIRPILSAWVRLKERLTAGLVERFLLAEKAYLQELPFMASRALIIENKVRRSDVKPRLEDTRDSLLQIRPLRLLFSGTIAKSTGVFVAIDLASRLNPIHAVHLTIVGYCPEKRQRDELISACSGKPFIKLTGVDKPVPHEQIINEITMADLGIVSYPENPSTWTCIPTKIYEYMAARLPMFVVNNPLWVALCNRYHAAVVFDPKDIYPEQLLSNLNTIDFYPIDPQDIYWESESMKLLEIL